MRHNIMSNMFEELLDDSEEIVISANSKRSALISLPTGSTFLIEGDFSGTPEECKAEARRILSRRSRNRRR